MSRRTDNPMTILIMGIVILCGFGVSLVLLTDKTPVLSLKPLVTKQFNVPVRARFRRPAGTIPPAVEVILEKTEDYPADQDEVLAAWSLGKYLELVKETEVGTTTIRQLEIRVEGEPAARFVLTRAQFEGKLRAEAEIGALSALVQGAGLSEVQVEVLGYSRNGARIAVRCAAPPNARRVSGLARRALLKLQALDYLGSIELEVKAGGETLELRGGRDTPLRRHQPPKRRRNRPAGTASPAPVNSRGP